MENKSAIATEVENVLKECVELTNNIVSKKREKDQRRINEKTSEYSLKFLNNFSTPDEKLAALTKKYNDVVDENRRSQMFTKQWEKKYVMMQREKEQLQLEYNKAVLLKSKLENLCRELQKQIKEESILKNKKEDENKEVLAMFQNSISKLTAAVHQNNEKNSKLMDANVDMKEKFKTVMEQYELREQHVEKITKQMNIEAQLAEAKLAKATLEAQAEREKMLAEKKQLLVDLTQYQARCNELQATEVALRSQVAMYTDKYDEFQNALTKSSEVFGGFKGEMEKMSKKVEKQQKEAIIWKQRWEKSHTTLLEMVAEKQQADSTFALQAKQLAQLQKLCRTMQAERNILMTTLRENNIERPALPQLPPEPEPTPPKQMDKADVIAQLKQSLNQIQTQLNDYTTKKKIEPIPEPQVEVVQKKSKKSKNKKSKAAKGNVEASVETLDNEVDTTTTESVSEDVSADTIGVTEKEERLNSNELPVKNDANDNTNECDNLVVINKSTEIVVNSDQVCENNVNVTPIVNGHDSKAEAVQAPAEPAVSEVPENLPTPC